MTTEPTEPTNDETNTEVTAEHEAIIARASVVRPQRLNLQLPTSEYALLAQDVATLAHGCNDEDRVTAMEIIDMVVERIETRGQTWMTLDRMYHPENWPTG